MATTALVDKGSIDLGRKVIAALGRAGIPVAVGLWAYASESEEWQLTIATPLVDEVGPLAAYGKVQKALQKTGVADEFPPRRIFLRSPKDRVIRSLQKESRALENLGREDYRLVNASIEGSFVEDAYLYTGSIDIICTNEPRGNAEGKYSVIYVPGSGGGLARDVPVQGLGRLRDFLEREIGVHREIVDHAIRDLAENGNAAIPNVQLKPSKLKRLGLA
ncbi:MAG: hypothetical protein ACHP9V_06735 [Terriglobales bacterium]